MRVLILVALMVELGCTDSRSSNVDDDGGSGGGANGGGTASGGGEAGGGSCTAPGGGGSNFNESPGICSDAGTATASDAGSLNGESGTNCIALDVRSATFAFVREQGVVTGARLYLSDGDLESPYAPCVQAPYPTSVFETELTSSGSASADFGPGTFTVAANACQAGNWATGTFVQSQTGGCGPPTASAFNGNIVVTDVDVDAGLLSGTIDVRFGSLSQSHSQGSFHARLCPSWDGGALVYVASSGYAGPVWAAAAAFSFFSSTQP